MDQAEIVFTTLASSAWDVAAPAHARVDTVLVDERRRRRRRQTLVPFLLGAERCVLVGDLEAAPEHGALGRKRRRRSSSGASSSVQPSSGRGSCSMSVQTAMHPEISAFPSRDDGGSRTRGASWIARRRTRSSSVRCPAVEASATATRLLGRYVFFDAYSPVGVSNRREDAKRRRGSVGRAPVPRAGRVRTKRGRRERDALAAGTVARATSVVADDHAVQATARRDPGRVRGALRGPRRRAARRGRQHRGRGSRGARRTSSSSPAVRGGEGGGGGGRAALPRGSGF